MVYGGGDIVFDQKGQTSGCSEIVVYSGGTLPLVQKGQTSGCSGCSTQWTQYAVGTVDAVE